MPYRYQAEQSQPVNPKEKPRLFHALRQRMKQDYNFSDLRKDLMSGAVVGMVAIPLGMALAIASGVPPQHGLYTVILAGIVISLLGGSRFQVTGPTAAFVVILAPIAGKFGLGGLLTAGLIAGIILLCMGLGRMGQLIQFIPYPVTTGFTSGIAVVIATLQMKDFFGLHIEKMPDHYLEKIITLFQATPTASWVEFLVGLTTLLLLVLWPKINRKIPAPLVALTSITICVTILKNYFPAITIATIGSRFSGIPQTLPLPGLPWHFVGSDQHPFNINLQSIEALILPAFAIAMLGAIESLLSAVVADGMAHTKHDPDSELMALGIGNMLCPFFGGIAATGAIARTATNIRYGASSPLSSVFHGVFTLLVILLFAPYVSYLPMSALSALLLLVAFNMAEIKHFKHIIKVGVRSDVAVLLICFGTTVLFDMVIGVTAGILLAALMFMKRMATVTSSQIVEPKIHSKLPKLPSHVLLYDINGPLFFGAAERAMEALDTIHDDVKTVFLLLEDVPVMDMTGLVAFEGTLEELGKNRNIFLIGVKPQPRDIMLRSSMIVTAKNLFFFNTIEEALADL